jgi:hypothetical protein
MARYDTYSSGDDRIAEELDRGYIGFNNRLRPDQLTTGILFDSKNGRMSQNGEWQTRKGIDNIKAPLAVGGSALTLPFDLDDGGTRPELNDAAVNDVYGSCIFSDPNDDSESYIILAANTKAVAIKVSDTSVSYDLMYPGGATISAPVEMIQAFNRLIIFRDGEFGFQKDFGVDGVNISDSPTLDKVTSGEYTQPLQIVALAGEFAIVDSRGIIHQTDGIIVGDTISVISPSTSSQTSGLKIGETFIVAKVYEEAATKTITAAASPNGTAHGNPEYAGLYQIILTSAGHGYDFGDPITIAGFPDADKLNGKRFVADRTVDTFTVYVPQNPNLTISGDETVNLANGFEFFIDAAKTTEHATDGETLLSAPILTKRMSSGLGFTHMPAPEYGVYHQRRLAVPYKYSVDDATDSYTNRKIFDEILLSDVLDIDTYDQVYAQFRFNAGRSDFNVGMLSFSDDKLIVFNRNSIHLVVGSGDLSDSSVQLLTDEVGLIARNSVVQVGNQVLFLSDNGVYGLSFIDLYNLRGQEVPLSESIQKTIDTINKDHADKAVAVYFDNKYYLAVPTGTSTTNNTLLIYNFLNKSWESVDNVNNVDLSGASFPKFEFTNLLVAGTGANRGVYSTNTDGGIHRLEVFEDGIDRVITAIGETDKDESRVQGSVSTRMFTLNSIDRKKWNNFELHLQSGIDNSSNVSIAATTENLDSEPALDLKKASDYLGGVIAPDEDVSIRGRIGNKRAYGLQVTLTSILGRPRFRSLKIAGAETFRSTSSVQ